MGLLCENIHDINTMTEYRVGEGDERPWGSYLVTGVGACEDGEGFCEKEIRVNPGKILSLQSHRLRRELWVVREGLLTVIVDGKRIELRPGQSVIVPLHAIHCMANLTDELCVVFEKQMGICREEDIERYVDAYGRAASVSCDPRVSGSVRLYNEILAEIEEIGKVSA
ncbi:MAG: cupin domain-containing protein [Alphaproteobacteria bacterium]|nr:cupin domain-containing protein [Alphaproteobacteria bacterium]